MVLTYKASSLSSYLSLAPIPLSCPYCARDQNSTAVTALHMVLVIMALNLAKKCLTIKTIPNQTVLSFGYDFKLLKIYSVVCLLSINIVN